MRHFDAELILKKIVVRKAKLQDAGKIHDVLRQAFSGLEGRGYSSRAIETAIVDAKEIERRILFGGHVLVAEVDSEIVGTVTGFEEHRSMYVCSLAVRPKHQNVGVARRLMVSLEKLAQDMDCNKLFLCTARVMKEAIRLYEGLGYFKEGYLHKHFYGEDFIVFSKLIKENTMDCTQEARE